MCQLLADIRVASSSPFEVAEDGLEGIAKSFDEIVPLALFHYKVARHEQLLVSGNRTQRVTTTAYCCKEYLSPQLEGISKIKRKLHFQLYKVSSNKKAANNSNRNQISAFRSTLKNSKKLCETYPVYGSRHKKSRTTV